ncbi:DUF1641 domain-containing protein [Salinibacter ruber]|uniref:DUF1641 domain-containing protein n=1 Tax=Salinibacter ruber TaxID=146919 RepID=UPI002072F286|nr:DUF1641 domain-containing protein [Salinibacter ruber]
MDDVHTDGAPSLEKRLQDRDTRQTLHRLLDKLDTIEAALDRLDRIEGEVPPLLQTTADVVDDELTRAADRGVVLDERAGEALRLAEKLTEPETAAALEHLLDRSDQIDELAALAEKAPDAIATVVDILDAEYARAAAQGYDPERTLRQAFGALSRLGTLFQTDEFEALLHSGVLDPEALEAVGSLGSALVDTQKEAQRGDTPSQGVFGLLGALRDPDVQRAVGFITTFAKKFGGNLRS